ncbi:uncharacterized protein LOC144435789 [Glandiceps talaboti]
MSNVESTDCLFVDSPIPDGLGGCFSCLECLFLSYPPEGCAQCRDIPVEPSSTAQSLLTSTLMSQGTTNTTNQVSIIAPAIELGVLAVVVVLFLGALIWYLLHRIRKRTSEGIAKCHCNRIRRRHSSVYFHRERKETTEVNGNITGVQNGAIEAEIIIGFEDKNDCSPHCQDSPPAKAAKVDICNDISGSS